MNINQINLELKNSLDVPFSCTYDNGTDEYFIHIFNVSIDNQEIYRNKLYDLEDTLFLDNKCHFHIFIYDQKETKLYFNK